MGKNIYNENVYLSGDEAALSVFLKEREKQHLLHTMERITYKEVILKYNKYLLLVRDFLKSLHLNTSLENAIAISYLINHGFLSFNTEFDGKEAKREIDARLGMTIVKGHGCCRNFSDIGKDLMALLDYYVKKFYCYQPNLSLPKSACFKQANHVINLIEYDGVKYGIDLYQGCGLYYFKNRFTMQKVSLTDDDKIRFKPYYEIIKDEGTLDSIQEELIEFDMESKKRHVSPLIYEDEIRPDTISFLEKNRKLIQDFHEDTNEMKEDIVLSLTK